MTSTYQPAGGHTAGQHHEIITLWKHLRDGALSEVGRRCFPSITPCTTGYSLSLSTVCQLVAWSPTRRPPRPPTPRGLISLRLRVRGSQVMRFRRGVNCSKRLTRACTPAAVKATSCAIAEMQTRSVA